MRAILKGFIKIKKKTNFSPTVGWLFDHIRKPPKTLLLLEHLPGNYVRNRNVITAVILYTHTQTCARAYIHTYN